MTDQEIVQGFIHGNAKAYAEVRNWINAMLNHAAKHHRLNQDDIAGETIEKLLRLFREGAFRGESSLKTYVQRITKYTTIDAVRLSHVRQTDSLGEETDPAGSSDTFQEILDEEQIALYRKMLRIISAKCRDVWELIFSGKMSYKQIATQQGVSESAIKLRVHRCKEEATEIIRKLS